MLDKMKASHFTKISAQFVGTAARLCSSIFLTSGSEAAGTQSAAQIDNLLLSNARKGRR
jgi:hypothetical protein